MKSIIDQLREGVDDGECMTNMHNMLNDAEKCNCLLYTSPSPRDKRQSRMPSSA